MAKDSEIKNLLAKIISDYESVLKEQRERILALREENKRLAAESEALRKKENQIGKAMMYAVAKAREIDEASKLRYRTEMQRLREFHVRWKKYYECLYRLAPAEDYAKLGVYLDKMDGVFEGDLLGEDSFESAHETEQERVEGLKEQEDYGFLFEQSPVKPEAREEGAAAKPPEEESEEGFDLDEVLYPKNLPDLESLCAELGLRED